MSTAYSIISIYKFFIFYIVSNIFSRMIKSEHKHKNIADTSSKFFLRLEIADRSGVLANIASVLGNSGVSIAQVVQKKSKDGVAELVIITDEVKEKHFNDAMAVFKGLSAVKNIAGVIRVY